MELLSKVCRKGKLKGFCFGLVFCLTGMGQIGELLSLFFYSNFVYLLWLHRGSFVLLSNIKLVGMCVTRKAGHLLTSYSRLFSLAVTFHSTGSLGSPKPTRSFFLSGPRCWRPEALRTSGLYGGKWEQVVPNIPCVILLILKQIRFECVLYKSNTDILPPSLLFLFPFLRFSFLPPLLLPSPNLSLPYFFR